MSRSRLASRTIAVLVAAMALASVAGCATSVRRYECAGIGAGAGVDPHAVWDCHRDIANRAARGQAFTLREFREAAAFFERLTGVPADVVATELGPTPGRAFPRSLTAWDAWYEANAGSLVWDARVGRVVGATP